ncbi:hypothetical protein C8J57DRAFT_1464133, partial [Mycena rebaudengoi]
MQHGKQDGSLAFEFAQDNGIQGAIPVNLTHFSAHGASPPRRNDHPALTEDWPKCVPLFAAFRACVVRLGAVLTMLAVLNIRRFDYSALRAASPNHRTSLSPICVSPLSPLCSSPSLLPMLVPPKSVKAVLVLKYALPTPFCNAARGSTCIRRAFSMSPGPQSWLVRHCYTGGKIYPSGICQVISSFTPAVKCFRILSSPSPPRPDPSPSFQAQPDPANTTPRAFSALLQSILLVS